MITAEKLLEPLSGENPCGRDLSNDNDYFQIDSWITGEPETQFSPAKPPKWVDVHDKLLGLWGQSKDLKVGSALVLSSLVNHKLPGFTEALALLHGAVERYWDTLYPLPEVAEGGGQDFMRRVNFMEALATPLGQFGDNYRIIERVRDLPLAESARAGKYSLADVVNARTSAADAPTMAQIDAALEDTAPDMLTQKLAHVRRAMQMANGITKLMRDKIGNAAPNFGPLVEDLGEMEKLLAGVVAGAASEEAVEPSTNESGAQGGAGPKKGSSGPGTIETRADVVKAIETICQYYQREEPSSPVPLILRRAQRLATMNFMDIIADLNSEAVSKIREITGEKPPSE